MHCEHINILILLMFLEKHNSSLLHADIIFCVYSALKITQGYTTVDCSAEKVCHAVIISRGGVETQ